MKNKLAPRIYLKQCLLRGLEHFNKKSFKIVFPMSVPQDTYASVIMSIKITLTPSKICLCYLGTACRYINYVFLA